MESDDFVIKSNSNVADFAVCSVSLENDKCSEEDGGSSTDLFSDKPLFLEDYCIPSLSELNVKEENSDPMAASAVDSDDGNTEEQINTSLDQLVLLNKTPTCSTLLPRLEPLANHSIMFSPHFQPGDAPQPYPSSYRDIWDSDHVCMPCSPQDTYPVEDNEAIMKYNRKYVGKWNFLRGLHLFINKVGRKRTKSKWDLICASLSADIRSSEELEEAIMKYNRKYVGLWNFRGLHLFVNKDMTEEEREHFFKELLPAMVEMTLNLPNICTQPLPFLKSGTDCSVTLSQKQIGCLLLNAFFCTWTCEYASYPEINFKRLFFGEKNDICSRNAEKLKCLINYFRRITTKEPSGIVTFHRQYLKIENLPKWNESVHGIRTAVIKSDGVIETEGHGLLQVDFANKFVGGGVLGQGCVQEEIRFIICPELIVSRLFVEYLGATEVMIVTGVEQYSKYSGYADNFKFEGNFIDTTPRDSWGRRYTQLVAMDATLFPKSADQFKPEFIVRELNKAYSGFYENALPQNLSAIATGNWGCGAFKGNVNLKFLIQLMAATEAGRSLIYFTFGSEKIKTELQDMYNFLTDKNLTVGDVWKLLTDFSENLSACGEEKHSELYDFIYAQFFTKENNIQQNPAEETQSLDDSDKSAVKKLI